MSALQSVLVRKEERLGSGAEGSPFVYRLPQAKGDVVGEESWSKTPSKRATRVLVVEDEALIALDIERRLTKLGYDVVGIADHCEEALLLLERQRPDIVLMDICIQGEIDGIETAKRLGEKSDIPVVFLTAFADDLTVKRALSASPYGYLLKPFDERALAATLAVTLERYEASVRLQLLSQAVESASVGILLVSVDDEGYDDIEVCNRCFLDMVGYSKSSVVGNRAGFYLRRSDEEALQGVLRERRAAFAVLRGARQDGEPLWLELVVSPVESRSAGGSYTLLFCKDITSEKGIESALLSMQKFETLGRFTTSVVHDINNMLSVVLAFSQFILMDELHDGRRQDLSDMIQAVEQSARLTRKLLDFSRPDQGGLKTIVNVSSVVDDVLSMAKPLMGYDIEVRRSVSNDFWVYFDGGDLFQVILNLVVNARDAMPSGGELRVEVRGARKGTWAEVEVSDSGVGINPENLERIFDPFFTTKKDGKGTGMGLYTSLLMVERAGGRIDVKSELKRGTSFVVSMPLALDSLEVLFDEKHEYGDLPDGLTCLLLVEDEFLRRLCERALSELGLCVFAVRDVEEAARDLMYLAGGLSLVVSELEVGEQLLDALERVGVSAPAVWLSSGARGAADVGGVVLRKPFPIGRLKAAAYQCALSEQGLLGVVEGVHFYAGVGGARKKLLLVGVRRALVGILRDRGFDVDISDPVEALELLGRRDYDLLLLDVGSVGVSSAGFLAECRRQDSDLHVLVLGCSAREEERWSRWSSVLCAPYTAHALMQSLERSVFEGQMARLQRRLLCFHAGERVGIQSWSELSGYFEESLRGVRLAFQPVVVASSGAAYAYDVCLQVGDRGAEGLWSVAEALDDVERLGARVRDLLAEVMDAAPAGARFLVDLHPLELRLERLLSVSEPLLGHAGRVWFKVSTRSLGEPSPGLTKQMEVVREAGYSLLLDGLGGTDASVWWFSRLAPPLVRLDEGLVRGCAEDVLKREVLRSIVEISERVGARVIGGPVRSVEEVRFLRVLGCHYLYGPWFGEPCPLL